MKKHDKAFDISGTRWSGSLRSAFILVLVLLFWPKTADTCAPEFPRAIFVRANGPDGPLRAFAGGRIGIPLPGWRRGYLAVAYRYLAGTSLSRAQQESFLDLWEGRSSEPDATPAAVQSWLEARGQYRKDPPPANESAFSYGDGISERYMTCYPNAFETAVRTVRERANQFGAQSLELQDWIRGQDTVFQNCGKGSFVPSPGPVNASPLLRADRAYQTAAAHFYSGNVHDALREFDAIAADQNSPWHLLAPYLAVRTLIRASNGKDDSPELKTAEERIQAILADARLASIHEDARELQGHVLFRLHPQERRHQLARLLEISRSDKDFGQHLLDYTLLLDQLLDQEPDFPGVERWTRGYRAKLQAWRHEQYAELKRERSDDLTDWLMTIQTEDRSARDHALRRWRATASSAWLFALAIRIHGDDPAAGEVLQAISRLPENSPAHLALAYHRARLLREVGQGPAAMDVLNATLQLQSIPVSAKNLLKDQQLMAAPDFPGFLDQLSRKPIAVSYGWDTSAEEPYCAMETGCNLEFYGTTKPSRSQALLPQFDVSAAEALNRRVPVEVFAQVALATSLPETLRLKIAPAAWARAALLGNPQVAQKVAEVAGKARPELVPYLNAYAAANSDEERRFAAVFAIMHFPGLRPFVDSAYPRTTAFAKIDDYRDNWWCSDVGGRPKLPSFYKQPEYWDDEYSLELQRFDPTTEAGYPNFLNERERTQADEEWRRLIALELPKNFFADVSMSWARRHPHDPRTPEALHYAWRSQRWGCDDGKPNHRPRELFNLLHREYPKSEWTWKTTVWW